ncbi:hypothetical protein ABXT08_15695 [Chryseobacterium sp. NRRL B-14859]|uniref:hypothetical protein n=1 Tax=Chryseobacterium sp. NRRL B-14859 TaxID=1562763 RepID=UPI0033973D96
MKTRFFLTIIILLLAITSQGQNKKKDIIYEKKKGEQLIVPFQVDLENPSDSVNARIEHLFIENPHDKNDTIRLDEYKKKIGNTDDKQYFNVTFYAVIGKDIEPQKEANLKLLYKINTSKDFKAKEVKIIQAPGLVYTLTDYLGNSTLKLNKVSKVESANNTLTLTGYNQSGKTAIRKVELREGEILGIKEWSAAIGWNCRKHWNPIPISLITVPFKIRPSVKFNDDMYSSSATSGLTNIGVNLDLIKYQVDRYFVEAKKSTHKFSLGLLVAPSVEELEATNTNYFTEYTKGTKSKQLFISTGLTLSYSYNDLSFVIVPIGWDITTSSLGKNWMYGGKRWWGFGIGISPKIFSTILNSTK